VDNRPRLPLVSEKKGISVKRSALLVAALVAILALGSFGLTGCGGSSSTASTTGSSTTGASTLSGSINVAGSDTMVNLAQAWSEAFTGVNPDVTIAVKGGGSGTGITALINGTTDFANSSRNVKDEEKKAMEAKGGTIVETAVAKDGISVIVNPANKVSDLTVDQLGQIYRGEITNWSKVGGADAQIVLLGRDTSSGTYEFFKEAVVGKDKKYAASMRNMQSNQAILSEVENNANAIGYVGLGYAQEAGTKVKRLMVNGVVDTPANVLNKSYPLSRDLYMVSNGEPKDLMKSYLDWILGPDGQKIVSDQGFVPLQ
jgi:phosphate transport system substrate-binding protein